MALSLPAYVEDTTVQANFERIAVQWDVVDAPQAITAAMFAAPWRNFLAGGGANADGAYWIDRTGVVHLHGLLDKAGGNFVANETMLTLPVGFRPVKNHIFTSAMSGNGGAGFNVGQINVTSAGLVQIGPIQPGGVNPVYYVSISGITFSVG